MVIIAQAIEEINEIINKELGVDSTYNPLKSKTITLPNYDKSNLCWFLFNKKKKKFIRYKKSRRFRKNSATKKVFNTINTNSWGINFKKSWKNIYSNSKFKTKKQSDWEKWEKNFTHALTVNQLVDLKTMYKHFSLKRVDKYVFENPPLL